MVTKIVHIWEIAPGVHLIQITKPKPETPKQQRRKRPTGWRNASTYRSAMRPHQN